MKNIFFLLLLITAKLTAQSDTAQQTMNPKFIAAMEKQVAVLDTARAPSTLQMCYNGFERLANAEKKEWLPDYYMAYCLVMQSYSVDTKQVDDYCDRADKLLDRADSLSPNNSEIFVVRSMSAGARIRVNPMTRGSKYGKASGIALQKAAELDSLNPRVDLVQGQALFYTPPAFGGGKDKAKPILETSLRKYDAFKPKSSIAPRWGKPSAQYLISQCK